MANPGSAPGDLLPGGLFGLKDFETFQERADRQFRERKERLAAEAERARQAELEAARRSAAQRTARTSALRRAAADRTGNLVVASITELERLFAANPPDP